MKISYINLYQENGIVQTEALITWEEIVCEPLKLFFQTADRYKDYIWPDPNAFLITTVLAAWNAGERRILIEGHLCPALLNNLMGVFMMLRSRYPNDFGPEPVIETTEGLQSLLPVGKVPLP